MEISFIKSENDQHIISCKRKDGSVTWMHNSRFFIMHDLIHYSVETTLNLRTAFYGMLSSGTDIRDFNVPKERRTVQLSNEAIFAEQMVNLLGIEHTQGRIENFIQLLMDACRKDAIKILPDLKETDLNKIRISVEQLMQQWNDLIPGETIILIFED